MGLLASWDVVGCFDEGVVLLFLGEQCVLAASERNMDLLCSIVDKGTPPL